MRAREGSESGHYLVQHLAHLTLHLLKLRTGERLEAAREAEVRSVCQDDVSVNIEQVDNFVTLVHNSIPVPVVSLKRPTEFTWDPASTEVFSRCQFCHSIW